VPDIAGSINYSRSLDYINLINFRVIVNVQGVSISGSGALYKTSV